MNEIYIQKSSSTYAEEGCLQVFGTIEELMDTTSSNVVHVFAFESYTMSGSSSIGDGSNNGKVKIALVNFWTGDAGVNDRING